MKFTPHAVIAALALAGATSLVSAHEPPPQYSPEIDPREDIAATRNNGDWPWRNDLHVESRPHPSHGLGGRKILMAPGHGRTWNEQSNWWGWQRDVVHFGEVEDLITPRLANRWLSKYLENAGANVVTTRERDEQLHEVRMDDNAPSTVVEGTWTTYTRPVHLNHQPWMDSARVAPTTLEASATQLTWRADIPETDHYGLRIWYPEHPDATSNAVLIVHTAGGDVRVEINQQRNQSRWLWIDTYVFPAGDNVPIATMTTESSDPGKVVVADAIRIGGGMGDYAPGGEVSGLPRWQEYSKSWAITYGAPASVWNRPVVASDFNVRQAYLGWQTFDFFLELHTNASGNPQAQQTGTMVFWTQSPTTEQNAIFQQGHLNMIQMIRDRWLPTWRDDGFLGASTSSWPSFNALIEVAYHDRIDPDLLALLDGDFRRIAMRAIYQSIASTVTFEDVTFLPEPPESPSVRNLGDGSIRISWQPPSWGPAVDSYRVYQSLDGLAFDLGEDVGNVLSVDLGGFEQGDVRYYQVRAINEGGRSFETETIGVRVGDGEPLLFVNGFNRWDRLVQEPDNPKNFVRDFIPAFASANGTLAIDSATNDAVEQGHVSLDAALAVLWQLGKESTADETFSSAEQSIVSDFLANGGRLFVSGTDIAYDLIANGTTNDRAFARTGLFIGSSGARTTHRTAGGVAGTPFEGITLTLSGDGEKPYYVDGADVLRVDISGTEVLRWTNGAGAAAIAYDAGPSKVLTMSAPFEAILDPGTRVEVAEAVLDFLLSPVNEDTTPPTINNLRVTDLGPNRASIRWETNETASGTLRWGATPALGQTVETSQDLRTTHRVDIDGLDPETTYYFEVDVADFFGNTDTSAQQSFTTAPPDLTPPTLSNVVVHASDRDAVVVFSTDKPGTSSVSWGTTASLGNSTSPTDAFVTRHAVRIPSLMQNRTYHVKAVSTDLSGNTGESETITFQTLPTIQPLLVDNVDPGYQDTGWSVGSFGSQMIGTDYAFASTAPGGGNLAEWETTIPIAGVWQAHTNYVSGANRSAVAPYRVISPTGEQLVLINQQSGGGMWHALGSAAFYPEGAEARVTLSNEAPAGFVVLADAIRWTFVQLTPEAFLHTGPSLWMLY